MVKAEDILADILAGKPVKYDYEIIEGDLDLSKLDLIRNDEGHIIFPNPIEITNSEIRGEVNFRDTAFQARVSFVNTKFCFDADFWGAQFSGDSDFYNSHFGEDASFQEAWFCGYASFYKAQFDGDADFDTARFCWEANFWRAKFNSITYFYKTQFDGDVYFWWAQFRSDVEFRTALFYSDVTFEYAKFSGYTNFSNVNFSGYADFSNAKFSDCADFFDTRFSSDADFIGADFDRELNLTNLKFNRLYITWNSIKRSLDYDGPAYLALIKNFKVIERFGDADDCYYQYRKESQDRKILHGEENGWDWSKFSDTASWISCGYGVRPIHTVICMLCIVVIGWVIFMGSSESLFESFYFSVMTFTGGDPDNLMLGRWMRTVAMIEAIFGYLFMALFVVVLGRKLIR